MKISISVLILFTIIFLACQSGESPANEEVASKVDLKKALPGTWESISVTVNINTANNTDSSYVFEVKEENWESKLGLKPLRSYYDYDNKYRLEYRSLVDTVINIDRGIWNVFGDTLMLIEPKATYQYIVKIENGFSEFRRIMDWDGDGEEDDEYLGIQRYVSKSVN